MRSGRRRFQRAPSASHHAVILLGMCGYLSRLTQTPLNSAVICMEITDDGEPMLLVLATVLIARARQALVQSPGEPARRDRRRASGAGSALGRRLRSGMSPSAARC
ncbi:chloride channel protein [Lysobacter enzymogenes]|uniref:chloride channel protein n=1 Tax=Lysobacter enzymogenes TaxID=69 RepID=UPI003CCCCA5A